MNRTTKYKLGYTLAVLALIIMAVVIVGLLGGSSLVLFTFGVIFLIPGRIQGFYYRDLFIGRRLLDEGKPEEAIPFVERFLSSISQHPHLNKLLWLSWAIYTPNVVAMAKNNLGAARLELGLIDEAEQAFSAALDLDPLYPIPYFNIAIIHELRGNRSDAVHALGRARQFGFTGGTLDAIISKGQGLLARVEGRLPSA